MEKIFYLAQIIDGLHVFLAVIVVVSGFACIGTTIATICTAQSYDESDEYNVRGHKDESLLIDYYTLKKWATRLWITVIVFTMSLIFVPSKQTYLFMVGGRVVDLAIEHNPDIKELPENTLNLLNEYIKTATDKISNKDSN